jgi:hypothetical protein
VRKFIAKRWRELPLHKPMSWNLLALWAFDGDG